MKQTKLYVLLLLVCSVVISSTFLPAQSDNDNFGKIVGQIFEANTGKPVHENFVVTFFKFSQNIQSQRPIFFNSDINGNFSGELEVGRYYIIISPVSRDSIYCFEPNLLELVKNEDEFSNINFVDIRKGQITKLIKTAKLGGKIILTLVDENGNEFDPRTKYYENIRIRCSMNSDGVLEDAPIESLGDSLRDGKSTIGTLYPALYKFNMSFDLIGYGDLDFELNAKSGQVVEKKIIIDMTNQTGIEGIISDENGQPIENAVVKAGTAATLTNQSGYYKLLNIKTGKKRLKAEFEKEDGLFFLTKKEVLIQEGIIAVKNITINLNK